MWRQYRDLYAGGEQFKINADQYLVRRQKEPGDVYAERLSRSFYENYVGSIVDWYTATLFRREPVLAFEGRTSERRNSFRRLSKIAISKEPTLRSFSDGNSLRRWFAGRAIILIDFPRLGHPAGTRAEEDERGASRAYLVSYAADELINWSYDEHGQYQWVVLRTQSLRRKD